MNIYHIFDPSQHEGASQQCRGLHPWQRAACRTPGTPTLPPGVISAQHAASPQQDTDAVNTHPFSLCWFWCEAFVGYLRSFHIIYYDNVGDVAHVYSIYRSAEDGTIYQYANILFTFS